MSKWYIDGSTTPPALDFSKPIAAFSDCTGEPMLLMPCLDPTESYKIKGYNWFRLSDGQWNSCSFFATPEQAVNTYRGQYEIKNVTISMF